MSLTELNTGRCKQPHVTGVVGFGEQRRCTVPAPWGGGGSHAAGSNGIARQAQRSTRNIPTASCWPAVDPTVKLWLLHSRVAKKCKHLMKGLVGMSSFRGLVCQQFHAVPAISAADTDDRFVNALTSNTPNASHAPAQSCTPFNTASAAAR